MTAPFWKVKQCRFGSTHVTNGAVPPITSLQNGLRCRTGVYAFVVNVLTKSRTGLIKALLRLSCARNAAIDNPRLSISHDVAGYNSKMHAENYRNDRAQPV
ncbi:hypothetical protein [Novosphingobium sp. 17-62-19]|uniref:hypothetical protein n=1 Tax=Novosphingobium sp. 17-62-19 TaxID=1970406 RepID=UPI0025FC96E4|nr:hypothetical protein [Novosphingobium sp. 17-62-19]HQS96797.1 hypothetical protein [Novosphingobium sp.]